LRVEGSGARRCNEHPAQSILLKAYRLHSPATHGFALVPDAAFLRSQHPQRVDADRGAKDRMNQGKDAEDDGDDPPPRLACQQREAGEQRTYDAYAERDAGKWPDGEKAESVSIKKAMQKCQAHNARRRTEKSIDQPQDAQRLEMAAYAVAIQGRREGGRGEGARRAAARTEMSVRSELVATGCAVHGRPSFFDRIDRFSFRCIHCYAGPRTTVPWRSPESLQWMRWTYYLKFLRYFPSAAAPRCSGK